MVARGRWGVSVSQYRVSVWEDVKVPRRMAGWLHDSVNVSDVHRWFMVSFVVCILPQ